MSTAFGDFDPRFPGISLTVGSPTQWDRLRRYSLGDELPSGLSSLNDAEFLETVSSTTVVAHEMRHFHDFLLSPTGSRLMRTRVLLGLNLIQLLVALRGTGIWDRSDVLPVPLTTWCRWSRAERAEYAAAWSGLLEGRRFPFDLPRLPPLGDDLVYPANQRTHTADVSPAAVADLITIGEGFRRRLIEQEAPPDGVVSPRLTGGHLGEASAFLVQVQEVYKAFGDEAAQRFFSLILSGGNRYGVALHNIGNAFDFSGAPLIADLLAVFTGWILLGDPQTAPGTAHPLVRFALLTAALKEKGPRAFFGDGDLLTVFPRWDEWTGQPATLDGLRQSLDRDAGSVASLRAGLEHVQSELADWAETVVDVYERFTTARGLMVRAFLREPWAYLSPASYLHNAEHWVAPLVRVSFADGVALGMGNAGDHGWRVAHGFEDDGRSIGKVIYTDAELAGIPCFDEEDADLFHSLLAAADVIIGPDPADVSEVETLLAQEIVGEEVTLIRAY
ncbi:hypothetical protein [Planotetraspora sp. GP83]|uniref:hypothetical protein n=1 Tax=Planotetraspora sp. GP83 TaxID=3156264 RepID=UPI003517936E